MPYTEEATEAGARINSRPWWHEDALAALADGEGGDVHDPCIVTLTRGQAAQVTVLLTYAAMQFDMEFSGERAADAVDLAIAVGDQLFPLTEQEVQQAVEAEADLTEAAAV